MKNKSLKTTFLVVSTALLLVACGPKVETLYSWNGYSNAVLTHYKDGTSAEEFSKSMAVIVLAAETDNKIPPGLYAEYGYALLEAGQDSQAVIYFQKERDMWPESEAYMDNIIFRLTPALPQTDESAVSSPSGEKE